MTRKRKSKRDRERKRYIETDIQTEKNRERATNGGKEEKEN